MSGMRALERHLAQFTTAQGDDEKAEALQSLLESLQTKPQVKESFVKS
eukprot:CAMPEP_0118940908 /NCGR_PEP_ID=MMETSP1169-20130426/32618_1 /TAXON_ID=36882 /ORGANISM="Pyramimonas obovata, Strain CCMP722" /LENGTH=47 /DNA_ID= /DNA_START= /DNA_END= /DNA_ORIENTATION=